MSDLWKLSGSEVAKKVRDKSVSVVEVTESTLARLNAANPAINAIVQEMPEEALKTAQLLDAKLAKGENIGPLGGVPVTIKVNVDQVGFATTNGVRLQESLIAEVDNPVVANIKDAGAVIVGRTNTPAFSLRWFTRSSLHGHTLNPHNPEITPGGSSGGAAAATAAGIGAVGHGTDIAGSIRYPAYTCGVHGLRPSFGRVPAANFTGPDRHIGAQLMAVSGPMARTMDDIELSYKAMACADHRDPWWTPVPHDLGEQPKRVALCVEPSGVQADPVVEYALRDAASRLESSGWIVDEVKGPDMREPARLQALLWLAEFRRGAHESLIKEDDQDALFVYQQMERYCEKADTNDLLDCLQRRVTLARDWQIFFDKYPVLLCPNSAERPFIDQLDVLSTVGFDRVFTAQLTQIAPPFLGLPGLSVATGIGAENIPMGVQLISARFREDTLLAAGRDIESTGPDLPPVDPANM